LICLNELLIIDNVQCSSCPAATVRVHSSQNARFYAQLEIDYSNLPVNTFYFEKMYTEGGVYTVNAKVSNTDIVATPFQIDVGASEFIFN
jgi:5-deoxy-D-glucuronate isomerase